MKKLALYIACDVHDVKKDYLRINIVDCVNGDDKMSSENHDAGIMGWLGPYGDGGTKIPNKVEVYIDRCRNYATKIYIALHWMDLYCCGKVRSVLISTGIIVGIRSGLRM